MRWASRWMDLVDVSSEGGKSCGKVDPFYSAILHSVISTFKTKDTLMRIKKHLLAITILALFVFVIAPVRTFAQEQQSSASLDERE
jgi:hypothetical protein